MSEAARRQRRSNRQAESETRFALLEAARDCVRKHGLAKTTSRMIAARANANLASITYYFGSKDELIAESLLEELATRLGPVLETLEAESDPAPTRLLAAMQALVADYEQSKEDLPVFLQALVLSAEPGPFGERALRVLSEVQARLGEVIGGLKLQGVIADWVEPDAMASLLVATAQGMALHAVLHPNGPAVPALAGQLAGLLLEAGRQADTSG